MKKNNSHKDTQDEKKLRSYEVKKIRRNVEELFKIFLPFSPSHLLTFFFCVPWWLKK
jgi:hypothetical protein